MVAAAPEMLIVLLLLGGPAGSDLVTILDPVMYFEARQIDVSIDKMARLAGATPEDGKAQIMQLLALRYLAEHPDKLRHDSQYAAHHKLLKEIAAGKRAQDADGFARDYAAIVLARLDGLALAPAEPARLHTALDWFPADATLVAAADLRHLRGGPGLSNAAAELLKEMPVLVRNKLYANIETAGNVRFDRIAVAVTENDKEPAKSKVYVRITVRGNAAWMRSAIQRMHPAFEEKECRDPASGKPIAVLRAPEQPPVILFVDQREILLVGYARAGPHADLVDEVLAVRAGKQPSVLAGPLKARLQAISARAMACAVGAVPAHMRKQLAPDLQQFALTVPARIDAAIERLPAGFDASITAGLASADDARGAVTRLGTMRKEWLNSLQQLLKQPDADPRLPAAALINLLQSVQMQHEDAELRLRALVPHDALQGLPAWLMP